MPTAKPINRSDYGLPTSVSGVPGGLDLGPALLSLECRNCGTRVASERDDDGRWTMRLAKCPKCGEKL